MIPRGSIFTYANVPDFMSMRLKQKQKSNPRFSLRAWALQLGLTDAGMLSRVISGKRPLSTSLAEKVAENLGFSEIEKNYFRILVFISNTKDEQIIFFAGS